MNEGEERQMPNILLTRIDNRLIHGQVATQWNSSLGANLILVANDDSASNTLRQSLMDMAAPAGVATRYWTIEKTIKNIHRASASQRIFIVCETPIDVLKLVEGGVPIKKVNIGNMHMAEGKRQVATTVAVDDNDVAAFAKLLELGVELDIRKVPNESSEDVSKLFK
jgi:PTS system N-acetylgalactosamine-specific IIB component